MGRLRTRSRGTRAAAPVRVRDRVRNQLRRLKRRVRPLVPARLRPGGTPAPFQDETPARLTAAQDRVEISAASVGQLRAQLTGAGLTDTALGVDVLVTEWRAPWPGWVGRLGPLPGLVEHSVRVPAAGRGPASVRVTLAQTAPVRAIVAAVLPVLDPTRPLPTPIRPEMAVVGDTPPWLSPGAGGGTGGRSPSANLRPRDVILAGRPAPPEAEASDPGLTLVSTWYGAIAPERDETILVDATAANPRGRQRNISELPAGVLSLSGEAPELRWRIDARQRGRTPAEPTTFVSGRLGEPLDGRQAAALGRLGRLALPTLPAGVPPAAYAAVLAQLAMTGAVLHTAELPKAVEVLLAPELVAVLGVPLPRADADAVDWELRSVRQRRAAMRGHDPAFALPLLTAQAYPSLSRLPTVSALLLTRRPEAVAQACAAMAAQSYPEMEIVLGLHGCELPAEAASVVAGCRVPVTNLALPAELSFGEALAAATRAACGSLVTKVDDDDRYGPEHVWDLVLARHYSGATLVGKAAEFTYLAAYDTTVRRRMAAERYSDVVAGGAMLLAKGDLEAVGGWRPVPRSVDRALLDRVLAAGGLVYRTHPYGFVYTRHAEGHTWDPGLEYFLRDPLSRWSGLPPYSEFG